MSYGLLIFVLLFSSFAYGGVDLWALGSLYALVALAWVYRLRSPDRSPILVPLEWNVFFAILLAVYLHSYAPFESFRDTWRWLLASLIYLYALSLPGIAPKRTGLIIASATLPIAVFGIVHSLTSHTEAQATLLNANVFAAFLELPFFLVLRKVWVAPKKVGWVASFAIILSALLLSQSAGATLSIGFGLAFWGISSWPSRPRNFPVNRIAVLIFVAGCLTLCGITSMADHDRVVWWKTAWGVLQSHPWLGIGPGGYSRVFPGAIGTQGSLYAHNFYLQTLAEWGILGMGAIAWLMVNAFRRVRNLSVKAGLLAIAIHASIDFHMDITAVMLMAFVAAGLTAQPTKQRTTILLTRQDLPWIFSCLTGFLFLFGRHFYLDRLYARSEYALQQGQTTEAVDHLTRTIDYVSSDSRPFSKLAQESNSNSLRQRAAFYREGLNREKLSPVLWYGLIDSYLQLNLYDVAQQQTSTYLKTFPYVTPERHSDR